MAARRLSRPLLALVLFWAALVAVTGLGALTLQLLGPPRSGSPHAGKSVRVATATRTAAPVQASHVTPNRAVPAGIVAPPDPVLLEPVEGDATHHLPRISADGRLPRDVYAVPYSNPQHLPEVALVVDGIGLSHEASLAAIRDLPGAVTLAVSAYAHDDADLLAEARARGHELLLSLPMEPEGSPDNDEGPHQLSLGQDPSVNARDLDWALSRLEGYVGVTNSAEGQHGEHVAGSSEFGPVSRALDRRGLLYVTSVTPITAPQAMVAADLIVDDPADDADMAARLDRLEALAEEKGCAVGLAGPLRTVTINRLRLWSHALAAHGLALVPVTAMLPGSDSPCHPATANAP